MNTRIIIILTGLMLLFVSGYAQIAPVKTDMRGHWEVTRLVSTLFSQGDDKVLERKVWTTGDSIRMAGSQIPLSLLVEDGECTITGSGGVERDSCRWESYVLVLWEPARDGRAPLHYKSWQYSITETLQLEVDLPAAFYMDDKRKIPVKRQFRCVYSRK
ncbi:hypothetical protein [Chitinophaga qingshengii]|uniref:Lipocalin-like domain-containing protein n=1 Tax=Chitinophaga qingshengii TaxID=1569794 RepID=A0ABR7TJ40_9BACT|nr:hypothetical protein [Chitinophaga qingshengii]MBC9929533.1 hypothetical protein [Chitinophaga qingshengii]